MTTPLRAFTYARVSTADQVRGTSPKSQREQTADLVKAKGWTHVGHFVDEGVSGAKDSRPELDKLMAKCRAGEVDVIVVSKLDRFSRSMKHLVNSISELDELGVAFVSVSDGVDTTGEYGKVLPYILGVIAEFEKGRITERMMDGHRQAVLAGHWRGGPSPYGYRFTKPTGSGDQGIEVDQSEKEIILRIVDLVLNGSSTYEVATKLNIDKIPAPKGGLWTNRSISWILRKETLTGTWVFRPSNSEPIDMDIEPILDEDTWQKVQEAIKGKPRPQRSNRVYALTGRGSRARLHCDQGGNYFGKTDSSKKGRTYYQCRMDSKSFGDERCSYKPRIIRTEVLEGAVVKELLTKLDEDYLTRLAEVHLDGLNQADPSRDLATVRRKLSELHHKKLKVAEKAYEDNQFDFLHDLISDIDAREQNLREEERELQHLEQLRVDPSTVEKQVHDLVATAKERLSDPSQETIVELFDLIDLDLVRVGDHRFEGTASIPVPEDGGEVWTGTLRRHGPRPPRSGPDASPA